MSDEGMKKERFALFKTRAGSLGRDGGAATASRREEWGEEK